MKVAIGYLRVSTREQGQRRSDLSSSSGVGLSSALTSTPPKPSTAPAAIPAWRTLPNGRRKLRRLTRTLPGCRRDTCRRSWRPLRAMTGLSDAYPQLSQALGSSQVRSCAITPEMRG